MRVTIWNIMNNWECLTSKFYQWFPVVTRQILLFTFLFFPPLPVTLWQTFGKRRCFLCYLFLTPVRKLTGYLVLCINGDSAIHFSWDYREKGMKLISSLSFTCSYVEIFDKTYQRRQHIDSDSYSLLSSAVFITFWFVI